MEFSATGVVNHNNTEYDSLNSSINKMIGLLSLQTLNYKFTPKKAFSKDENTFSIVFVKGF